MQNEAIRDEKAARGAAWAAAGRWAQVVITIVQIAVIARFVGPEAFGIYTLARLVIGVGGVALEGPIAESLIAAPKMTRGHANALFALCLVLALFCWALVSLLAAPLASVFGSPQLEHILPVLGIALIGMGLSAPPVAILMRDMSYRPVAIVENGSTIVSACVGMTLAVTGYGVWSLVIAEIVRLSLRAVIALWLAGYRPGFDGTWSDLRAHTRFTLNITGGSALAFFEVTAPRVIVGLAFGERALGAYALALRLAWQVFALVIQPFSGIATASARETRSDEAALHRFMTAGAGAVGAVAYPAFVGIAAIAPLLLPFAFGPEWTEAILPTQIVMLAGLRVAPIAFFLGIMRGVGHSNPDIIVATLGAALTFGLTLLAVPFGLPAVAMAYLARNIAIWPLVAFFVHRHTGYPFGKLFTVDLASAGAALIMGAVVTLELIPMPDTWPILVQMLLAIVSGVIVYAGALALLAPSLVASGVAMARTVISKPGPRPPV